MFCTSLEPNHYNIIKNLGCSYFPIVIDRKGINPFQNIKIYFQYLKIFKIINPQIILTFTIKPNIFSSIGKIILHKV